MEAAFFFFGYFRRTVSFLNHPKKISFKKKDTVKIRGKNIFFFKKEVEGKKTLSCTSN